MILTDYQQYIAKSRYARYLPSEKRRETWAETVDRYVSYFGDKYPSTFPMELIRNSIYNLEVMPSMRAVMTAGKALDRDHAAGYNCLSGDTLVTTLEYGIIPIEQLAGISAHVVDGNGDWVLSECSSHGIQKLYRINFATSGKGSFGIRATGNHRWIKKNGEETTTSKLNNGDRLATVQTPGVNDISDCAFGKVIEVVDVIEDGKEEVYCFNVPTTHSFLLTKNLLTGNCAFLAIDDHRAFDEGMYLLMCFSPDTEVLVKGGVKKISELLYNDEVLSFNEENKSYEYIIPSNIIETPSKNREKIELELEDGFVIHCTSDHKFLTSNRGWVEAKNLTEEDDIKNYHEI